MKSESKKRNNQEYFAIWDKKIETTSMCIVTTLATLVIIFVFMNIFILAMLGELNLLNLQF
jgi:hypothetical protein